MGVGVGEIVTGLVATAFAGTDGNAGLRPTLTPMLPELELLLPLRLAVFCAACRRISPSAAKVASWPAVISEPRTRMELSAPPLGQRC
jgi:hypothetical protein